MNKKTLIAVTFCLALSLSMGRRANAGSAPPEDLATADWSVNARPNLATKPPPKQVVQSFVTKRYSQPDIGLEPSVISFAFADLRQSGTLSLTASLGPGGTWRMRHDPNR